MNDFTVFSSTVILIFLIETGDFIEYTTVFFLAKFCLFWGFKNVISIESFTAGSLSSQ